MWNISWRWIPIMLHLIRNYPIEFKYSLVFHGNDFDNFAICSLIEGSLIYKEFLEIIVLNIKKPLLNLLWKSINVLLSINYKSHKVGGVVFIIKGKKHFSQIRTIKRIFITCWKFIVRVSRFWKMFTKLIFSPSIILQIFRMLRVNSI